MSTSGKQVCSLLIMDGRSRFLLLGLSVSRDLLALRVLLPSGARLLEPSGDSICEKEVSYT